MNSPIPSAGPEKAPRPFVFDAVLHPHCSLGPRGFLALMVGIGLISFVAGMAFVLAGAWPVMGFFGLDVLLVYLAFRVNYVAARRYETVRLSVDTLVVERVAPDGTRREWQFQPYWLRVSMDDPPRHDSKLTLTSHGRSLVIGAFLSPDERLEFAQALRGALDKLRGPAAASTP
jgi:uncharacterized membrane protein